MELLSHCPEKLHCPVPLETLLWMYVGISMINFLNKSYAIVHAPQSV